MSYRVAINGFGRIGRLVLRAALERSDEDMEFVAVNDLTDAHTLAHLFKYDSVHGQYPGTVETDGENLVVDGKTVRVLSERDPAALPWRDLNVDIVVESSGIFTKRPDAAKHLEAGARKVLISAPAKEEDLTVVLGCNEDQYDPDRHHVISNASCTTNCLAPVVRVVQDRFGFQRGLVTTVHAYTNDQSLLDAPHKDLRRARAGAVSLIPTTTGAAKATGLVLPGVKGKLDGLAVRAPNPDVSLVDLVAEVDRETSKDEVNDAFREAARGPLEGILEVSDEPLVSADYIGHPASAIVDAGITAVMEGRMVKVLAWYDNEWGYSVRCVDMVRQIGRKL